MAFLNRIRNQLPGIVRQATRAWPCVKPHRNCYCLTHTMEDNCIIPDVIDKAPKDPLIIIYKSGVVPKFGNQLDPIHVKDEPRIQFKADPKAFYTLCMTDPDAPEPDAPKWREWHHWLVGNIPGADVSKGEVLAAYVGAGPPKGSPPHRYVFLLYKQTGKCKFNEQKLPNDCIDGRGCFKIRKFAKKYKLGDPIAGNFFYAEYDFYVPRLYKQLGQ